MITKIVVLLFSILLLVLTPQLALAQTQTDRKFDVTVSPTFVELTAKPGSKIGQSVKLRNNTDQVIVVKPEIKTMGGNEQGELTIKETPEEHVKWLSVKEESIKLNPQEWTTVNFVIDVPGEAAFGYYWALSFTADNSEVSKQTGTTLTASIAVPILLSVEKDGAKTEGKFIEFKTDSLYYEYPPVSFKSVFQNNGNVHIRPIGNIFIKDFLGRTISTLNINESQGSILPTLNRTFETVWNDGFITYETKMKDGTEVLGKNGKPEREMKIHYQKLLDLRIGKYTASAVMVVSGADRDYTYEKTISFFVFPWKVVLVFIGIIIFVGIGLFTTGRSIFRKIKGIFKKK